jgi:hypothetical protein
MTPHRLGKIAEAAFVALTLTACGSSNPPPLFSAGTPTPSATTAPTATASPTKTPSATPTLTATPTTTRSFTLTPTQTPTWTRTPAEPRCGGIIGTTCTVTPTPPCYLPPTPSPSCGEPDAYSCSFGPECTFLGCFCYTPTPTPTNIQTRPATPTPTSTASSTPTPTPTKPPSGCHNTGECEQIGFCLEPGGNPGSGATPTFTPTVPECVSDSDCARFGETFICSTQTCVPGCTAETICAVGQVCAASHHCVPRPCASDGDCPQFFACYGASGSTSGGCNRRVCDTDTDCFGGFCVNSRCYDKLGTCIPPPE